MADRQAVPPSDGDLDEPPGGGSPAAGSMGAQGAQDALGSDREAFARFQRFLQMERDEGRGPLRQRRRREREDEEGDESGEGRGASGPPPAWDGQTPFEDYHIKAQLWIATKAKSRGILSTYLQQKKTYTQSIKDKKNRELARGYGAVRRSNFGGSNRGDRDRDRPLYDPDPTQ